MNRSAYGSRVSGAITMVALVLTAFALVPSTEAYAATVAARIVPRFGTSDLHTSAAPLSPAFSRYRLESYLSLLGLSDTGLIAGHGEGYVPGPLDLHIARPSGVARAAALPTTYDLRTTGKLTPVKDQGQTGCCWTFATFGSLESYLKPADTEDFSEDNMALTAGFGPAGQSAATLYGKGGNYYKSTAYLTRWAGPVYESDEPFGTGHAVSGLSARRHVQDVMFLPTRTGPTDNSAIKNAVMTYGAVGTDMDMDQSGPYYNSVTDAYYYNGADPSDHAVDIVGWDDNYPASSFKSGMRPPGNGAWLVRNSWGTSWGDAGYFHVSYYDTVFAYGLNAVFDDAGPTTNYGSVLQYDPLGLCDTLGYGSNTAWFMNKFTVAGASSLKAIAFYCVQSSAPYQVYAGIDGTSLQMVASGTMTNAGYHTVPLASSFSVPAGGKLDVAVKLTTPGEIYPIPIECPVANYSDQAVGAAGRGFVSADGTNWTDVTQEKANADVCLKAFLAQSSGDTIAPTTTSDALATPYVSYAAIHLSATDNAGGSGVAHTYYKLDGGAQTTYSTSILVGTVGAHSLEFWSVDVAGNVETPHKTVQFTITAAPLLSPWTTQTSNSQNGLQSAAFPDASHGWTVGLGGTILHTADGGVHWSAQSPGTSAWLTAVAFPDSTHGWVVTANGAILHTSDGGAHWAAQTSPTTQMLLSAAFPNASRGWAVGTGGTIIHTTDGGAHWTAQASGKSDWLESVVFVGPSIGWIVGDGGIILHTTDGGAHWISQTSGTTSVLQTVDFSDATHGWAAGANGKIFHTADGGAHWTAQASGTAQYLYSVAFPDATHWWAVGAGGTVLVTADGGAHWTAQPAGANGTLFSVAFPDATHGWAVGMNGTIVAYRLVSVATSTKLSCSSSVKVNATLQLTGTVSPSTAPGSVTVTITHLVGKKWKAAGSGKLTIVGGSFSGSCKMTAKGSWRFVATYVGGTDGRNVYKSSKSAIRSVTVK